MVASVIDNGQLDDELNLLDLLAFARRNTGILIATTLIGAIFGGELRLAYPHNGRLAHWFV